MQLILKKLVAPVLLCCIGFAPKVQPGKPDAPANGFPGETLVINARPCESSVRHQSANGATAAAT
ncbi:hypothetical protein EMIT0P2_160035 [Pseudomonas sp. IT-P2]